MNVFDAVLVGGTIQVRNHWGECLAFEVTPKIHKALYVWVGLATVSSVATGYEDDLNEAHVDIMDALDDASGGEFRRLFGDADAWECLNAMLENTFFSGYDESIHATGYDDLSDPIFFSAATSSSE